MPQLLGACAAAPRPAPHAWGGSKPRGEWPAEGEVARLWQEPQRWGVRAVALDVVGGRGKPGSGAGRSIVGVAARTGESSGPKRIYLMTTAGSWAATSDSVSSYGHAPTLLVSRPIG